MNLDRVEVFWRPLTSHLLDACQHPHLRMREWGAEAITTLTRAALQHSYPTPLKDNQVGQMTECHQVKPQHLLAQVLVL